MTSREESFIHPHPAHQRIAPSRRDGRLWNFLTSPKTALILFAALSVAAGIGSFIPQDPALVAAKFGPAASRLIAALSLDHLYTSWWFILVSCIFMLSLLLCGVKRWRILKIRGTEFVQRDDLQSFQEDKDTRRFLCLDFDGTGVRLLEILKELGYSWRLRRRGKEMLLVWGERGRLRGYGSLITHIGLFIVFAGALAGGVFGFSRYVEIREGETLDLPQMGFSMALVSFKFRLDEKGRVLDYVSDLLIEETGGTKRKVLRVNHPLRCQGVKIYQMACGISHLVIEAKEKQRVFEFEVPIEAGAKLPKDKNLLVPAGSSFALMIQDFFPFFSGTARSCCNLSELPANPAIRISVFTKYPDGQKRWEDMGWVFLRKPVIFGDLSIELKKVVSWSGLTLRRDPGVPVVFAGFWIIAFGLVLVFGTSEKVVRLCLIRAEGSATLYASFQGPDFSREITRLKEIGIVE